MTAVASMSILMVETHFEEDNSKKIIARRRFLEEDNKTFDKARRSSVYDDDNKNGKKPIIAEGDHNFEHRNDSN